MDARDESNSRSVTSLSEWVTRLLRHEVGDLLQTVYATVAILQKRLPHECAVEHRVLADMRARAESCKRLLDTVHDLVYPVKLSCEPIDLADLTANLVTVAAKQHPELKIQAQALATPLVRADVRALVQVGNLLLANACEAARQQVWFRTEKGPADGEVEWTVTDDGPGVTAEQVPQLFTPLATTRHGRPGLGLALARKLVLLHGGRITADNVPEGGFRVRVVLPGSPPEILGKEGFCEVRPDG